MRVGIDFGTTHTVAAVVDRGNYPVVSFDGVDTWPSIIAANDAGELRFGLDAAAVRHDPALVGAAVVQTSTQRRRARRTTVELAGRCYRLADLFAGFLAQLKSDLRNRSNAELAPGERVEAAISVPANASSAQRFLTLDAFAQAGFEVIALLNEPSAAGFEYAHRYRSTITAKREHVLIYDLGGGTFDASLLKMTGRRNEVVVSEGIQRLGGDDFDETILKVVRKGARLRKLDAGTRDSVARGVRGPQGSRRPEHPPIPGRSLRGRQAAVFLPDRRRLHGLCAVGRQDDRGAVSRAATIPTATTSTGPRWRASTW